MLKKLASYIWGSGDDESDEASLPLEFAYNVVGEAANISEPLQQKNCNGARNECPNDYEVRTHIGIITNKINENYVIDDIYTFSMTTENLSVGTKVSYQIFNDSGKFKICNVVVLDAEDWNIDSSSNGEKKWHLRTIVCQVTDNIGCSIVVSPGDIKIDLNAVKSDFTPIVGDWLDLEAKCEINEQVADLTGDILEISRLRPLRPQLKSAKITKWDSNSKEGVIDGTIYFNKESLCNGFWPSKGETVFAEVIESNQQNFSMRALKVIPDVAKDLVNSNFSSSERQETAKSDHGITITDNIYLSFAKVGDVKLFSIEIESDKDIQLISAQFSKLNGQCRFLTQINNITLRKGQPFTVQCECKANGSKDNHETITFNFPTFNIQRHIRIDLDEIITFHTNRHNKSGQKPFLIRDNRELLRGRPQRTTARFIPIQMPDFQVPEKLKQLIASNHSESLLKLELEKMRPALASPLTSINFEDRFHALLHLDEVFLLKEMQNYDQERACFIKRGEYLLLEIENLSERRPSIIAGDSIIAYNKSDKNYGYIGSIHMVSKNHVHLKFSQIFHDSYDGEDYSIYVQPSRVTYRREHWAIQLAVRNLGKEWLFPRKAIEKEPQVEFIYDSYFDSTAKEIIPESFTNKPSHNTITSKRVIEKLKQFSATKSSIQIPKLEWYNKTLNYYQKEAVRNVLLGVCRPLPYFIFGPPGTGKTVTLVEIILQILRLLPHSRLLVSAPSNSAADLLALRMIKSKVVKPGDLIRVVARTAVSGVPSDLAPYCCTVNVEKEGTTTTDPVIMNNGLIEGLNSKVIGRHRITVTTCSSAGLLYCMGFTKGHFTHIIVDEAGQASEPSVLIPLAFLDVSSGQAILAGDPMQLGPVVLSKLAQQYGLEETLLERLINKFPYERDIVAFQKTHGYDPRLVTKLLYNYRSLPSLLKLPSEMFYNDDLIATVSEKDSKEATLLNGVKEILPITKDGIIPSIVFHEIYGSNYQNEESPSWFNPKEASQVFYYVNELFRLGLSSSDIGIITPYKAQVKQLYELFSEAEFICPKVGTVEEFQGQEFNIIILSTVRSTRDYISKDLRHTLGFIANPRRLNVAITRAKALLIILGNPRLLVLDSSWQAVINYCICTGGFVGSKFLSG